MAQPTLTGEEPAAAEEEARGTRYLVMERRALHPDHQLLTVNAAGELLEARVSYIERGIGSGNARQAIVEVVGERATGRFKAIPLSSAKDYEREPEPRARWGEEIPAPGEEAYEFGLQLAENLAHLASVAPAPPEDPASGGGEGPGAAEPDPPGSPGQASESPLAGLFSSTEWTKGERVRVVGTDKEGTVYKGGASAEAPGVSAGSIEVVWDGTETPVVEHTAALEKVTKLSPAGAAHGATTVGSTLVNVVSEERAAFRKSAGLEIEPDTRGNGNRHPNEIAATEEALHARGWTLKEHGNRRWEHPDAKGQSFNLAGAEEQEGRWQAAGREGHQAAAAVEEDPGMTADANGRPIRQGTKVKSSEGVDFDGVREVDRVEEGRVYLVGGEEGPWFDAAELERTDELLEKVECTCRPGMDGGGVYHDHDCPAYLGKP